MAWLLFAGLAIVQLARTSLGRTSALRSSKEQRQHGDGQGRPEMESRLALERRWQLTAAGGAHLVYPGLALRAGLVLVAGLFVVELAFMPFYTRQTVADWVLQGVTL